MHAKTDSEVTSISASTPARSPPRRTMYYVQSPSRDSHDGEKTTVSSPIGSPPHSHSSRHSRDSSSTRFSASLKPKPPKPWKDIPSIQEESLLGQHAFNTKLANRRFYFVAFLFAFSILFSAFSLILWVASRPQKPVVRVRSITFQSFGIQAGYDFTGVATQMASINSTVSLGFRNTATFFGLHVTSTPLDLSYSQLTLASGIVKKFYESRKSQRTVAINVKGSKIPLYGGGASLSSSTGTVPLGLDFEIRSKAYVLGKLVNPKFNNRIHCWLVLDPNKLNVPISLNKSCTYD